MKIQIVTFTGADESVKPEDILNFDALYPDINLEWALLLSKANMGNRSRYPSLAWMEELVKQSTGCMHFAGHFQGQWLRDMIAGKFDALASIMYAFERIQLNFHGTKAVVFHDGFYTNIRNSPKRYILQMDGVNDNVYDDFQELGIHNVYPLFDTSAGAGIVPAAWPKPIHPALNGYAGGLGPDTIKEQLKRIEDVVGDGTIWIDMETRIRSEDDQKFDLDKCRRVLDVVAER